MSASSPTTADRSTSPRPRVNHLKPPPTLCAVEPPHAQLTPAPVAEATALRSIDQQLVSAIQSGNTQAAAPLYNKLRPAIQSALTRVLRGHPPDFDDLMQLTYEQVIRSLAQGRFEGRSRLKTWAMAIAVHVAVDSLRRLHRENELFEPLNDTHIAHQYSTVPEGRLEARSEARKIQGILQRMKPRNATVLILHDVLGHSVPQTAQLLGTSASAAQSALRRARQEFTRRCTSTSRPDSEDLGETLKNR